MRRVKCENIQREMTLAESHFITEAFENYLGVTLKRSVDYVIIILSG